MSSDYGVVVSIHGVRTNAGSSWQADPFAGGVIGQLFDHRIFDYGWLEYLQLINFTPINAALRVLRSDYTTWDKITDNFIKFCGEIQIEKNGSLISVVAHSFGTYILWRALLKSTLRFDKMILCGSPLDEEVDWAQFSTRINQVRNYYSPDDQVIQAVGRAKSYYFVRAVLLPHLGVAGLSGFHKKASFVEDIQKPHYDHSDYFSDYPMIQYDWLPFLLPDSSFYKLCEQAEGDPEKMNVFRILYGRDVKSYAEQLFKLCHEISVERWAEFIELKVIEAGLTYKYTSVDVVHRVGLGLMRMASEANSKGKK